MKVVSSSIIRGKIASSSSSRTSELLCVARHATSALDASSRPFGVAPMINVGWCQSSLFGDSSFGIDRFRSVSYHSHRPIENLHGKFAPFLPLEAINKLDVSTFFIGTPGAWVKTKTGESEWVVGSMTYVILVPIDSEIN